MITVIIVLHYLIFLRHTYMTDHAGPRLCESHPWTKFWPPPIEVINPVLATEEWFWRPIPFLKEQTKINSSVWNKTVPWTISNNFCFILFPCLLINIIFFDLTKNGRQNRFLGAKTAPWVPKLGYFDGRVPKVSSRWHSQRRGLAWFVICYKKNSDLPYVNHWIMVKHSNITKITNMIYVCIWCSVCIHIMQNLCNTNHENMFSMQLWYPKPII